MQKNDVIDIPGYMAEVVYGDNYGHPYVTQHNAMLTDLKEIAFYNDEEECVYVAESTLVAVWHIKPKQLGVRHCFFHNQWLKPLHNHIGSRPLI